LFNHAQSTSSILTHDHSQSS